jgi:transcriptional regulator with XRE-family HTH domain
MGFKENLKSQLEYSGMLVKELAALSGVKKKTIDSYLGTRSYTPSVEAAVNIAQALGVSVEYLVTGKEVKLNKKSKETDKDIRIIAQLAEQLDDEKRRFVIDFVKWIKVR